MTSEARQFDIVKQVEEFENTLSTIESHNHSMIKEIELEKNKINLMKENSLFTKIVWIKYYPRLQNASIYIH